MKAQDLLYRNETVSAIIPVYNASRYVGGAIESALRQTYGSMEVVVVDDCSTDGSREIISWYASKDDRVVCHLQERNQGVAVARNVGLDVASGRYVAFLDSDDIWRPEKIARQVELMRSTGAGICFTAIEIVDEENRLIKGKRHVKARIGYRFLLRNTMIATSSVMVDRNIVGRFHMPLARSGQDYATWLLLMRSGLDAYGIDEPLVRYRRIARSLSANKWDSVKQVWRIQTEQEGISRLNAAINVLFFAYNAFKKHFM
jgi:teichuronic acid biosynthesis glycosyltransferase TuaG